MKEITKVGELKPQETMTSLQIADATGKAHKNVCRDIKVILDQGVDRLNFKLSYYIDKSNREQCMYIVSHTGLKILNSKWNNKYLSKITGQNVVFPKDRFEDSFKLVLLDQLRVFGVGVVFQKNVDNKYKIDFYIPKYNLAIEYDENHHMTVSNSIKDAEREAYIKDKISCRFIRLDYKDSNYINSAKVLKEILKLK